MLAGQVAGVARPGEAVARGRIEADRDRRLAEVEPEGVVPELDLLVEVDLPGAAGVEELLAVLPEELRRLEKRQAREAVE